MDFAFISAVEVWAHLADIPQFTEHNIHDISVSIREMSKRINIIDATEGAVPDRIPVVIFMNFIP